MRRVGIVFILLGIVFAVLAGFSLFVLFPRQTQLVPEPTLDLVVAFQNIPEDTQIGEAQVGKASWPQHIPTPVGAFADPADVVGKLAQVPVYPGQPVVSQMLIARSVLTATHSNASLILEPGTLAVAIPVNTNSNVAEAVQPGDHVDLFANFDINVKELGIQPPTSAITEAETIKVTHLLLQDVVVLEVGTWPRPGPAPVERPVSQVAPTGPLGSAAQAAPAPAAQPSNPAPIVVTLQVKAQDASVLKYMEQNAASFSLALRPANDHALAQPTPVTIDYLMKRFGFSLPDMGR